MTIVYLVTDQSVPKIMDGTGSHPIPTCPELNKPFLNRAKNTLIRLFHVPTSHIPAMESRNNLVVATATSHGVLPLDLVFDVPAKEICRLRTVCRRPWRSLTSDPAFIKAHAARQPGPLIVASYHDDGELVHAMDLSGDVIKRVPIAPSQANIP